MKRTEDTLHDPIEGQLDLRDLLGDPDDSVSSPLPEPAVPGE